MLVQSSNGEVIPVETDYEDFLEYVLLCVENLENPDPIKVLVRDTLITTLHQQ